MKTLDSKRSEELYFKIIELGNDVIMLGGVVQNPDYITRENAQENYEMFYNDYKDCIESLDKIREEIYTIHKCLL